MTRVTSQSQRELPMHRTPLSERVPITERRNTIQTLRHPAENPESFN